MGLRVASVVLAVCLLAVSSLVGGPVGEDSDPMPMAPGPPSPSANYTVLVDNATTVTIFERTSGLYVLTYSVATLMGPGATWNSLADERYVFTSDGQSLTISCYRPDRSGTGHNIAGARLNGVPGHPNGVWASFIVSYTLGAGGVASTRFGALGSNLSNATFLGDESSELVLGFSAETPIRPPRNLTATAAGGNLALNWDPAPIPDLEYYEIYGGTVPYLLDFSARIGRTFGPETTWIQLNGTAGMDEFYYTVVAVNVLGERSTNTNTAGWVAVDLRAGANAFSLPLEPAPTIQTSELGTRLGADAILRMSDGVWTSAPAPVRMGEGYLVERSLPGRVILTGLPAAHIVHRWSPGFPSNGARLEGVVDDAGSVTLRWPPVPDATGYNIYRARGRVEFHDGGAVFRAVVPAPEAEATLTSEFPSPDTHYYLVVPLVNGSEGSTSYSIGVQRMGFEGSSAFGPPFRLESAPRVSAVADGVPASLGLLWLSDSGAWIPHFRGMPAGVFDAWIPWASACQITVSRPDTYGFVGY